jgi:hypothetical protein
MWIALLESRTLFSMQERVTLIPRKDKSPTSAPLEQNGYSSEQSGPTIAMPTAVQNLSRGSTRFLCQSASKFDGVDGARSRHRSAIEWSSETNHMRGAVHMQVSTIGLDLAKKVFQVHGVDFAGGTIIREAAAARPGDRFL